MAQRYHPDDRGNEAELKYYLLAGITPPSNPSRPKSLWASLFNQFVGSRK